MERQSPQKGKKSIYALYASLTLVWLALLALEIAAIFFWTPVTWKDGLTAVLAIVGVYGLSIGFIARSKTLKRLRPWLEELTSPNIVEHLTANLALIGMAASLVSVALSPQKTLKTLGYLGQFLYLILVPLMFAYLLFHIFVVTVFSYLPVVWVSAIVIPIVNSSRDIELSLGTRGNKITISLKSIVEDDPIAIKGFLIGVPALLISLISAISTPFIGG